jgi:F1F0 ATPase subunit 2
MTALTSNAAVTATVGLVAGLALGVLHFASLSWNAQLFVSGSFGAAIALQAARVGLSALVLILLFRIGPFAALAGTLGFLGARAILVWRYGEPR